jgi:tripartite-type tricarboxylate transporter receptor subunit TctC
MMIHHPRRKNAFGISAQRLLAAMLAASSLLPMPAAAQTYPNRPVRVLVPFTPGGSTDTLQRIINARLTEALGQQVLVDNRPGANTIVAAELVAKAPPDGYTLLQGAGATMVNNPLLYRKLPYDWQKSFAPISMMVISPYVLVASPSLVASSIKELIALAKRRPDELIYASSGIGSSGHLAGVLFDSLAGTRMAHIPYKGAAIGITDLISGQVPLLFTSMASVRSFVLQSKLKALGYGTAKRHPSWPDIPAIAETLPGYEMNTWHALFAPTGTPRTVIDRIQAEIARIGAVPDLVKQMSTLGLDVLTTTPEELTAYITRDYERVGKAVKTTGLTLD